MISQNILVHIKRLHENAILPEYKTSGASGFDLSALTHYELLPGQTKIVATGWAFEIPEGFEMQVRPRSGVTTKTGLRVILGSVDADYRGEVGIMVQNTGEITETIPYGMRLAQGVLNRVPRANFMVVSELDETARGNSGFGSTDGR